MIFLYHVDNENAETVIDGRLFVIPPNDLFEVPEIRGTDTNNNGPQEYIIPDKMVAQKILEHCWYHGVVQVPMIRTKGGVTSDVKAAEREARESLERAHDMMLTRYVQDQQERVTRENKPALAPGGRLTKIIERRGIDLKKEFNIDPPGWRTDKIRDRDAQMDAMQAKIDELTSLLTSKKGNKD